jgi:hypothetical protein
MKMKTFSMTMVSLMAMSGFVFAQGAAGSASAKAGAGATVKAPAGAGSAAAGAAGAAKAGAGSAAGTAAGAAKTGTGAAAGGTATAGAGAGAGGTATAGAGAGATAKMEMPKPPAELAATVKAMKRMNCTGEGLGMDMKTMAKAKGTVGPAKADLDGWWMSNPITMTVGEGKASYKMKMVQNSTFDAKTGKFRVFAFSNDGGTMVGTADFKDNKWEFVGEMSGPMGTMPFKEHGDMTDKKAVKFWGEGSMDKGKTWMKVYEISCK